MQKLKTALFGILGIAMATAAHAQDYPSKDIRMIVP